MQHAAWRRALTLTFGLCSLLPAGRLQADQFHYHNFLIGDRAIGMGGAYGGVSDDASGVFYNPAGLAFALSNDISGSANAFYKRKIVYKKTVGSKDFTETSGGAVPSFFGGLQKLDHIAKGLVFAFGMFTTDGELKNQDDLIEKVSLGQARDTIDNNTRCNEYIDGVRTANEGSELPNVVLERFHRTVNQRGSTYQAGGAIGWRVRNNLALGFGLNYLNVDELVQEYQDVRTQSASCKNDGSYAKNVQQLGQNIRQQLSAYGLQPVLAVQSSLFGRLSVGLTVKLGAYLSQDFKQTVEQRQLVILESDQEKVDAASSKGQSQRTEGGYAEVYQLTRASDMKNPLGKLPMQMRLGMAYFASTRMLLTFDATYVSAVANAEKLDGTLSLFGKEAVPNVAAGMEYYLMPSIPLRLGFFTNNDARPKVDTAKQNQRDHVDYQGGTIFLAWVQPNSQIGAGVVLQRGEGKAQKVTGPQVQEVEAQSYTFAFSASHNF